MYPQAVLVDKSQAVLELSQHYMALNSRQNVQWVCHDVHAFLIENTQTFDAIGVDLFTDMHVEHQFKQEAFYRLVAKHLNPTGFVLFNNVFTSRNERDIVLKRMEQVFKTITPINKGINTFIIARLTK